MKDYYINNSQEFNELHIIYKVILFLFFIFVLLFKSNNTLFQTKIEVIPEISEYKNQTLKLFIPSNKYCYLFPKTIFFHSKFRNDNETNNIQIETINLNENNKSYFATYIMETRRNFYNYYELLNNNGLIRSIHEGHSHNLFINALTMRNFHRFKDIAIINKFQKKYSFLNTVEFYHKDILYKNYIAMKKIFNDDYNYMSETYCYPEDQNQIYIKFNNYSLDINNLWLVKPVARSVGAGIHFFTSLKEEMNNGRLFLITKFISNLDLIDNKKYDLRLYVLISGLKPLRIYLYKKGLVRRASSAFNISIEEIQNRYMFLTNTGINQKNEKYIFPHESNDSNANIWNLDTYKRYLRSKNVDYDVIHEKIKDIAIKSIISFQEKLLFRNKNIDDRNVYTIIGIDILITDKFEPILLETNNKPSLSINNLIDEPIKTNLFADTLNIVGISLFSRNHRYKGLNKKDTIEESVNNALCELNRPRGDYDLIFPLRKNIEKYKKFFIGNIQENILFWDKIG